MDKLTESIGSKKEIAAKFYEAIITNNLEDVKKVLDANPSLINNRFTVISTELID